MPGKCAFQEFWLTSDVNKDLSKWLSRVDNDKYKAYCKVCNSKFDVSHSGFASIKSHQKGKKHKELVNCLIGRTQLTLHPFGSSSLVALGSSNSNFQPTSSSSCQTSQAAPGFNCLTSQATVGSNLICIENTNNESLPLADSLIKVHSSTVSGFTIKDNVTKAEIIWTLNKVTLHSSDRSCAKSSELFTLMFPDSIIASKFKMHKDKLGYVATFGLGPYFQEKLVNEIRKTDFFAVSVDESLNKVSQKGQMDIIARFWDDKSNQVCTRYLTSSFLGHSTALDLLNSFTTSLSELDLSMNKIIQISVDGPNVNLKILSDFQDAVRTDDDKLIDIRTCSLHIVHNSYKTAHDIRMAHA